MIDNYRGWTVESVHLMNKHVASFVVLVIRYAQTLCITQAHTLCRKHHNYVIVTLDKPASRQLFRLGNKRNKRIEGDPLSKSIFVSVECLLHVICYTINLAPSTNLALRVCHLDVTTRSAGQFSNPGQRTCRAPAKERLVIRCRSMLCRTQQDFSILHQTFGP